MNFLISPTVCVWLNFDWSLERDWNNKINVFTINMHTYLEPSANLICTDVTGWEESMGTSTTTGVDGVGCVFTCTSGVKLKE